jgi:hypothetical protein
MFKRFSGKAGRLGAEKGAGCSLCRGEPSVPRIECAPYAREAVDTLCGPLYSQSQSLMSVSKKIQVGQLWKKDGTKDIYLVTRLYSEALNTMVILRRSGAEDEAQIRVRVERAAGGQKIPGFSPAQEDEKF